jgi:hypothetical protein
MNSDELWKPTQQESYPEDTITKTQTPRRAFTSLDDVLQEDQRSGPAKHSSYHVPPGNDMVIVIEIVYYNAVVFLS